MTAAALPYINARYRLLERLGAGGMGTVYRAQDRLTGNEVALKQVNVSPELLEYMSPSLLASSSNPYRALAEEFRFLSSLRHPHIISVLDYGFGEQRQPYFTMELLRERQSLLQAGAGQTLAVQVDLLTQTLHALSYLHRRRVIHRDLKPENVQVVNGVVKVLDFGLALAYRHRLEAAGRPAGTVLYMAPEILANQAPSEAADLYAFGVIACELLTGHYPFEITALDLDSIVDVILSQKPEIALIPGNAPLEAILARLLSKRTEGRYTNAQEVIAALNEALRWPAVSETVQIRESFLQAAAFVGRALELSTLQHALAEAMNSHGSGWLIGGESGVGKSRLLDELSTDALIAGALVLSGQEVEGGGRPYQHWRDPLRRVILSVDLSDFEAGILKEIVADIEVLLGRELPPVDALPSEAGKQRLAATIINLFERQARPTVLLLEDLHWGAESLSLLRELNRFVHPLPLLIVGSYRNDERRGLTSELPGMQNISLARLDEDEIGLLSEAMLGDAGKQREVVDLLTHETEGNVFFMVEVVRALAEEAGQLSKVGRATLPRYILTGGVRQFLKHRLAKVPTWGYRLLQQAAVAGRQVDVRIMERLANSLDVEQWLLACAEAAVLEVREETWRFSHDKLRESVLADLSADERPRLHRQVAEVIEAVYSDDESYADMLAEHWDAAADFARAMPYLIRATRQMAEVRAEYARAQQWITRGMAYGDSPYRGELLHLAAYVASQTGAYNEAAARFESVLALPGLDPLLQIESLNGLSGALWRQSKYQFARDHAARALQIASAVGDQRGVARSLQNLSSVAMRTGDFANARQYCEESIQAWKATGDQYGLAGALNGYGNYLHYVGDYEASQRYYEETLRIGRSLGTTRLILLVLSNLGGEHLEGGNTEAALPYFTESISLARQTGDLNSVIITLVNLGQLMIVTGNSAVAQNHLEEALSLAQQVNSELSIAECLSNLGLLHESLGDYVRSSDYYDQGRAIFHQTGDLGNEAIALADLALALVAQGQPEVARIRLTKAIQIAVQLDMSPITAPVLLSASVLAHYEAKFQKAAAWLEMVEALHIAYLRQSAVDKLALALKSALGDEVYASARDEGKRLPTDSILRIIAYELGLPIKNADSDMEVPSS